MEIFKQITFKYEPGYFSSDKKTIKLKITKNYISYQELRLEYDEHFDLVERKGKIWKTTISEFDYYDLCEQIVHALYVHFDTVCDGDGTLVTATTLEGKKIENYIMLDFYHNGLAPICELLIKLLDGGVPIPPFIKKPELDESEEELESDPIVSEDKIRKLLKTYGAADKEIDNFINDLYGTVDDKQKNIN